MARAQAKPIAAAQVGFALLNPPRGQVILPSMSRVLLALLALAFAASARAEPAPFFPAKPAPGGAWWLNVNIAPQGKAVRGIPVKSIRADWCLADELTKEMLAGELKTSNGKDELDEYGLSFALEGSFDGSGVRQTAVVGIYETCRGRKGYFFLIFDTGTRKIRFLDHETARHPFAAIGQESATAIRILYCLECDISSVVRWDRARKRFVKR
jgi:hypothetical protein